MTGALRGTTQVPPHTGDAPTGSAASLVEPLQHSKETS